MRPLCVLAFIVFGIEPQFAAAETPPAAKDDRLDYLVQRLGELEFRESDGERRSAELQDSPLMTWLNPISGANGGVFVWTIDGRPVALTKTHVNDRKRHFIESSITLREGLRCTKGGEVLWEPDGMTAVDVALRSAAPPRPTAPLRLAQMRQIAGKFEIEDRWGEGAGDEDGEIYQLRLLGRPLYRYAAPDEGIVDGAIFGYSQGTNPEAVVVLEAVRDESTGETDWRCVVSRLTGYAVTAALDGVTVLDVPYLNQTNRTSPFRHFYQRLDPYPFDSTD